MNADGAQPLVSICIPVYNGARFLHRAIASAVNQTYVNTEIVIVDDCSTDESWRIIESFQDRRIVAMRNERNLGPEGNWNTALAAASGKYVKLFHQDDLLSDACIAAQVQSLEAHPEVVLAFCSRRIIGPQDQHYIDGTRDLTPGPVNGDKLTELCLRKGANLVGEPTAVLFRRRLVDSVGLFSAQFPYVIDLEYWVRLLQQGHAFYDDRALVSFRISPHQWSVGLGRRQSSDFVQFVSLHTAFARYQTNPLLMLWAKCRIRWNALIRAIGHWLFLRTHAAAFL